MQRDRTLPRRARWSLRAIVVALALETGCEASYAIGGSRADGAVECVEGCGRFDAPLDVAGADAFGDRALGDLAPWLLLRGEDARATSWPARRGDAFASVGPSELARFGPFNDATRGVRGRYRGALAVPDAALVELVFAAPIAERATSELLSAPVRVATVNGALVVGETEVVPLAAGAWHHLVLERAPSGTRVFVNGREQRLAGASATYEGALDVGGEATIAWLAISEVPPTLDVRARFAALTGTLAHVAGGDAAPVTLERESDAYADLVQDGARRLHRVGPGWPRVACRPDAPADAPDALGADVRCGYLAESGSSVAATALGDRPAVGIAVARASEEGPGEAVEVERLDGEGDGEHSLALPLGADSDQVISAFVRAASGEDVAIEVDLGLRGRAVFGLDAPPIVEGALRAHDEPWGNGWHRVWVVTEEAGEPNATLRVTRAGARSFAASGPLFFVAGVRSESNRRDPSSLGPRARDELAYATAGNVPSAPRATLEATILVDGWTRLHDATVVHFANETQVVNLYYSLDTHVTFAATGDAFVWNLRGGSVRDGRGIAVSASWGPEGVTLRTRDELAEGGVSAELDPSRAFDLFIVGAGGPSGELHGLVWGLRID